MKKLLIITLVLFSVNQIYAQKVTIKSGLTLSSIKRSTLSSVKDVKPGAHIGASIDIPVSNIFSVDLGAGLTTKGSNYEVGPYGGIFKENLRLYYIDMNFYPVKASFTIGDTVRIFIASGSYMGYGLKGNMKYDYTYPEGRDSGEYDIEWDNKGFRRFDAGLSFSTGVNLDPFVIALIYDHGLYDLINNEYKPGKDKRREYNRSFKVSIGYQF